MKRKYWILLISFIILCTILPFIIELSYSAGEKHPLICTDYSQSDMLGYISSVIGLGMSLLAIILSIRTNEIHIKIRHMITINERNNEAFVLEICNQSGYDCTINSVELCNTKKRIFSHIIPTPPFDVRAKNAVDFTVEVDEINNTISHIISNNKKRNIKYCICLAGNERLYLSSKELFAYLDNINRHHKAVKEECK